MNHDCDKWIPDRCTEKAVYVPHLVLSYTFHVDIFVCLFGFMFCFVFHWVRWLRWSFFWWKMISSWYWAPPPLLRLISKTKNGGRGLHYFTSILKHVTHEVVGSKQPIMLILWTRVHSPHPPSLLQTFQTVNNVNIPK